MSKTSNKPIDNAEEVIERFGGIRPLAHKIDVPVTTVQGWKKRNKIPAGRRMKIMEAAEEFNIDISDLIQSAPPANQNTGAVAQGSVDQPQTSAPAFEAAPVQSSSTDYYVENSNRDTISGAASVSQMPVDESLTRKLAQVERNAVSKSVVISGVLTGLAIVAVMVLFMPSNDGDRIDMLEGNVASMAGDVQGVKDDQSLLGGLIPKDLDKQIESLRTQAAAAQGKLEDAVQAAEKISQDVLAQDAGSLEERLAKLETHVVELTGSPFLAGMLARVEKWQTQRSGNRTLDSSVLEIGKALSGVQGAGAEQINAALDSARGQSDVLSKTFEGVPGNELKAAALLLGMSQVRSSLNRNNEPFQDDLVLLQNLVGQDDPALSAALLRLAPKAEEGVLTPGGLSDEFKSLAGDIVVASLKGEDISVQERASARFNELLQIEKDGELLTGTSTQATLLKTEYLLGRGDLPGAIDIMQTLEGPAGQAAAPWLEDAQATLLAQQIQQFLGGSIAQRAFGRGTVGGITASGGLGSSTLVRDDKTGINFLKRDSNPFSGQKGFKLGQ